MNFGRKYIYTDDTKQSKYNSLCDKMVERLLINVIVVVFCIIVSYSLMGFISLYYIVIKRTGVTFFSTEIPFVDIRSNFGYAFNLLVQVFLGFVMLMANICIEIGACLTYNSVTAIPQVIHLEVEELRTELHSNGMSLTAKLRLRKILMKLQDFDG